MTGFIRRGIQTLSKGMNGPFRGDYTGALVTTDGHARFQEAVLNGNVYIGANPAGTPVTTQAGLSATTPALTLFNPFGSTVNLVLWTFTLNNTSIPAASTSFELAYNSPLAAGIPTAPLTVTNANITNAMLGYGIPGTSTSVITQFGNQGQCYRVATLNAAPIAFRYLGALQITAAGSGAGGASASPIVELWLPMIDHIDGEVIIPPGTAVSIQTSAAAAVVCSYTWEEVPIG